MINYNYTLVRDEGHGPMTFRPDDLPRSLPNLVLIEGKNTKGKSTLLHILALACHGLRNKRISDTLKDKMQNLVSGGDNKITFSIAISDKEGNVEFISQKNSFDDDEIVVRDKNDELLTADKINEKYNIIYDVPENPLKRLEEMSLEVEDLQHKASYSCKLLIKELLITLDDIRSGRNPEKIAKHELDIKYFEAKIEDHDKKIPGMQDNLHRLKLYAFIKLYKENNDKYDSTNAKLTQLKKDATAKKSQKKKTTVAILQAENAIAENKDKIREMHSRIASFIPVFLTKTAHRKWVDQWINMDLEKELHEPEFNCKLQLSAEGIQSVLRDILVPHQKSEDVKHADTLDKLIFFLEELKDNSYEIPGINITIARLFDILKNEAKKYEEQRNIIKGLEDNISNLNEIISLRNSLEESIKRYTKLKKDIDITGAKEIVFDTGKETQKIEKDLQNYEYLKNIYFSKLNELDKDIAQSDINDLYNRIVLSEERRSLAGLSEAELLNKIEDKSKELDRKEDDKRRDIDTLGDIKEDLDRLKKKEPHKYHSQLDCLQSFVNILRSVDIKLDKYTKYLDLAKRGKLDAGDAEFVKYYDNLSTYLGERFLVGSLRYLDEVIAIKKIYIHTKTIETLDGRRINMKNISTGQTMRNYLVQRLHSDDPRKIIAFFDEVGMMDRDHLMDVINVVKKLYGQNRLLLAVIAQRNDECQKVTARNLEGFR